ncbi:MAG TPA: HD domain-containing phosphohydrolase [Solirubrobacteraceae bacterium]|nr:HD domain-containing phosphohydrolase [Solirubrobacteraceae bacterium]
MAELVASLSLGIDLGFGQPMEHVLRQCLIALRLAERVGLDEQARAVVYYTALLVNVGCHSDAYEQAKWFGDDIALKSGKFDYEPRSIRALLAGMRMLGAGSPPLRRLRVGLEFAISGHREVDDMIAQHAALAATLAEQLGLPGEVLEAPAGAYERWDGRGWPGAVKGADVPVASMLAQIAEYVEVAHRVGGLQAVKALARERGGEQLDPVLAALVHDEGEMLLAELKEIAERLVISPKTVARHIEHIYMKIDASTRAAASLFAMRNGLLPEEQFVTPAEAGISARGGV